MLTINRDSEGIPESVIIDIKSEEPANINAVEAVLFACGKVWDVARVEGDKVRLIYPIEICGDVVLNITFGDEEMEEFFTLPGVFNAALFVTCTTQTIEQGRIFTVDLTIVDETTSTPLFRQIAAIPKLWLRNTASNEEVPLAQLLTANWNGSTGTFRCRTTQKGFFVIHANCSNLLNGVSSRTIDVTCAAPRAAQITMVSDPSKMKLVTSKTPIQVSAELLDACRLPLPASPAHPPVVVSLIVCTGGKEKIIATATITTGTATFQTVYLPPGVHRLRLVCDFIHGYTTRPFAVVSERNPNFLRDALPNEEKAVPVQNCLVKQKPVDEEERGGGGKTGTFLQSIGNFLKRKSSPKVQVAPPEPLPRPPKGLLQNGLRPDEKFLGRRGSAGSSSGGLSDDVEGIEVW
eukprot:TRINITY_DN3030_c0_g1_i1.p1 TRINITY_DN3030_c0_g1~~TRINITY_DN3030_c0_g1_i1.p1  ORF type:complete len:406 (+),score=48.50 TRINITY_DN3030_c0_g1_i1:46-1263(+)